MSAGSRAALSRVNSRSSLESRSCGVRNPYVALFTVVVLEEAGGSLAVPAAGQFRGIQIGVYHLRIHLSETLMAARWRRPSSDHPAVVSLRLGRLSALRHVA